jgi:hypothetical protein
MVLFNPKISPSMIPLLFFTVHWTMKDKHGVGTTLYAMQLGLYFGWKTLTLIYIYGRLGVTFIQVTSVSIVIPQLICILISSRAFPRVTVLVCICISVILLTCKQLSRYHYNLFPNVSKVTVEILDLVTNAIIDARTGNCQHVSSYY